jgi:hypothetical protein
MAIISSLTRKGTIIKRVVDETVIDLWRQLNGIDDGNSIERTIYNRDFLICSQGKRKSLSRKDL